MFVYYQKKNCSHSTNVNNCQFSTIDKVTKSKRSHEAHVYCTTKIKNKHTTTAINVSNFHSYTIAKSNEKQTKCFYNQMVDPQILVGRILTMAFFEKKGMLYYIEARITLDINTKKNIEVLSIAML